MEETSKLKVEIEEKKSELIALLQSYCRSQVALWHQIPELAKEADKLNRFSCGRYKLAHSCYLWSISPKFLHGLQVDLRTGEIRCGSNSISFVDVLGVIELGQVSLILEQLDAMKVIKSLKDDIRVLAGDHTRMCR